MDAKDGDDPEADDGRNLTGKQNTEPAACSRVVARVLLAFADWLVRIATP